MLKLLIAVIGAVSSENHQNLNVMICTKIQKIIFDEASLSLLSVSEKLSNIVAGVLIE